MMTTGDGFSVNSGFTKILFTPEKPLQVSPGSSLVEDARGGEGEGRGGGGEKGGGGEESRIFGVINKSSPMAWRLAGEVFIPFRPLVKLDLLSRFSTFPSKCTDMFMIFHPQFALSRSGHCDARQFKRSIKVLET